jgi:hypothetical protein
MGCLVGFIIFMIIMSRYKFKCQGLILFEVVLCNTDEKRELHGFLKARITGRNVSILLLSERFFFHLLPKVFSLNEK